MAVAKKQIRLDLRLDPAFHKKLKRTAVREKRSLNKQIIVLLERSYEISAQSK